MGKYKVVMTDDRHQNYTIEKSILQDIDVDVVVANCRSVAEVIEVCKDADGILLNLAPMPAAVIEKLERCQVISRYGVGCDNVDVEACTARGIIVANVPDYCAEEVSDQALALLLACARKVAQRDRLVRFGKWDSGKNEKIFRIAGKVFTFLGFGVIARCLYRKIKGLGFSRILVYDPYVEDEILKDFDVEKVDWETALSEADFISIHMPMNDGTRGMIDSKAFGLMKPSVILINTSRGGIIQERDLVWALDNRKINSAGLDVFSQEPISPDNPLLTFENCVFTDHIGWYSEESMFELKMKAAQNIKDVLLGGKPGYLVNKKLA